MTATPVRTCVGCRRRDPRSNLLRIVLDPAGEPLRLAVDPAAHLPGRGAWVHPTVACVRQAVRRRAFTRALRASSAPDAAALVAWADGAGQTNAQ
jgi:predicted RNA-binding protein YlxR (DUF448 family)